jgi:hypothetical protein
LDLTGSLVETKRLRQQVTTKCKKDVFFQQLAWLAWSFGPSWWCGSSASRRSPGAEPGAVVVTAVVVAGVVVVAEEVRFSLLLSIGWSYFASSVH